MYPSYVKTSSDHQFFYANLMADLNTVIYQTRIIHLINNTLI